MEYWPWWTGAIALGLVTIIYGFLTGKPLGVSGSWMRIANWRDDRQLKESARQMDAMGSSLQDELMAMTLAEFGESAMGQTSDPSSKVQPPVTAKSDFTPWTVHLVFLVCTFIGSLLVAIYYGKFQLSFELSTVHTAIFGNSTEVWLSLLFGGMMVGFGTQMAGGCTSGHGLSGCSQFVPASLTSTFIFFGSAVVLSILMEIVRKGGLF